MKISVCNSLGTPGSCSQKLLLPVEFMDGYSKDATIHGVKYFSERDRHWTEKLFWVTIFGVSIYFCVSNVMEIYAKRQERPVTISFAESLTPVFQIPFPAVTICSEVKVTRSEFDFVEVFQRENLTEDELTKFKALYQVCEFRNSKNFSEILDASKSNESEILSTLERLATPMDEIFDGCRFGEQKFSHCHDHFTKLITDEGVCYTFNMLDESDVFHNDTMEATLRFPRNGKQSDWFLDKDYESMNLKVYPHRVIGAGLLAGLSVQLRMKKANLNPGCKGGIQGFRLSLHNPVEVPQMSKQFYNIPLQKLTTIAVNPHMIYPSENVKKYDPVDRRCYYRHEKSLKFFKIYSKLSCELECLTQAILTACGCVRFSMPRDNKTAVCNHSQLECTFDAERNYTTRDLERDLLKQQLRRDLKQGVITKDDKGFAKLKKMKSCNCLPSCSSLQYDAEISQTDYSVDEDEEFLEARINIYFKSAHFTRLKRFELYALSDFLSSTGGIFGLFLGCSVLSLVEIFYHLVAYTVRKIRSATCEIKNKNTVETIRI